jgi:hypothetical protein
MQMQKSPSKGELLQGRELSQCASRDENASGSALSRGLLQYELGPLVSPLGSMPCQL